MDERAEWNAFIDKADSIPLKITRLRTWCAQIRSDAAHGGPERKDQIADIDRRLTELQAK